LDKPSSFAHKEMSIFVSVIIKIGGNFLFCLSSRAMLHSSFHNVHGGILAKPLNVKIFAVTEGSAGHNILTPYRGLM